MANTAPVQVLICTSLTGPQYQRVEDAGPGLRVVDGAALLLDELPEALRPGQPAAPAPSGAATLDEMFASAEIILGARRMPADLGKRAPDLRWMQVPLAGTESYRHLDLWDDPHVAITSAAGVNAGSVAEYVLAAILALGKSLPRMREAQAARRWDRFELGHLDGKTVGIVGYGAIGRRVAGICQAFGMRVLATRRRPVPGEPSWVLEAAALHRLLAGSDFVVLALPATKETVGLIGPAELALMPPSAFLINTARGDVVDEAALLEALRTGGIAGAALDVFQAEPLAQNSPFWDMPNVLISPHVAGLFAAYDERLVDLFADNLRRYLAGQPLVNQVDRSRGY